MTVWIYINTAKEVGDVDHLKVFASGDAANAWFADGTFRGAWRLSIPFPNSFRRKSPAAP